MDSLMPEYDILTVSIYSKDLTENSITENLHPNTMYRAFSIITELKNS